MDDKRTEKLSLRFRWTESLPFSEHQVDLLMFWWTQDADPTIVTSLLFKLVTVIESN